MPGKCGAKFHLSKINFLLDNVDNLMPIAASKWDAVASLHDQVLPQHKRTAKSLRCKFQEIVHKSGPTGDPKCPAYVCYVKIINRKIVEMVDGLMGLSDDLAVPSSESNSGSESKESMLGHKVALEGRPPRELEAYFDIIGDGGEGMMGGRGGEKFRGGRWTMMWLLLTGGWMARRAMEIMGELVAVVV